MGGRGRNEGILRKRLWASHSRDRRTWSIGYRKELSFKVGHIGEHWQL